MSLYWNERKQTLDVFYKQFHVLIRQHLNGADLLKLSEVSKECGRIAFECYSCLHDVYVDINYEKAETPEDLSCIIRSKRKYRSFRFRCFDSKEITSQLLAMLELFTDDASTIEIYDMNLGDHVKELTTRSLLSNLKISSCRGEYRNVILQPFTSYESLHFENQLHPVNLTAIAENGIVYKLLRLTNCNFINLDAFNYFNNHCKDLWIESNRKDQIANVCLIFARAAEIKELEIKRKKDVGFLMKVHREIVKEVAAPDVLDLFSRRKSFAPSNISAKHGHQNLKRLEEPQEGQVGFLRHRTSSRILSTDSSNESISTISEISRSGTRIDYKTSLEIYDLTLPVIKKLAKSLPNLNSLRIFQIGTPMVAHLFEAFMRLRTVTVCLENSQQEFNRRMFVFDDAASDPMLKLSENSLKLCAQHFDVGDFKTASLVSKTWNGLFGGLESFMTKVITKLNYHHFKSDRDKILKRSQRDYQSLEIGSRNNVSFSIRALELVHVYSTTLVELSLSELSLEMITNVKDRFTFTRLEHLKLHKVDEKSCFLILQNCVTLRSIELSAMPILEYAFERIKTITTLKKLSLHDCNFDYFETIEVRCYPTININLHHFELTFERANSWLTQNSLGFQNFRKAFSVKNVQHFKVSGIRGKNLYCIASEMFTIKSIEIKHIWEQDLQEHYMRSFNSKFELQVSTLGIGENIDWFKYFPTMTALRVGPVEFNGVNETDEQFIKLMRPSAEKMIMMGTYKMERKEPTFLDPMLLLSEELHPLVLQHFNRQEVLNAFEVSQTWNMFFKESDYAARKYCLFISDSTDKTDRNLIEISARKYLNLICGFYQPSVLRNFSGLRKLSLKFNVVDEKVSFISLPYLDTLIIQKCPAKLYNSYNVLQCFKIFAQCSKLKFLEIYEAITKENVSAIRDMLENNRNLKSLKLHSCSEFFLLFNEDISKRISFRLTYFYYSIPEKFTIVSSSFEWNLNKFLELNDTLRIIEMNQISGEMFNTIFSKIKGIEKLRCKRITGFESINLEVNDSMKELMIPNTPLLFLINSNETFNFKPFFDAVPNIELLYVYQMTNEMMDYAARKLKNLKIFACQRFDRSTCPNIYKEMILDQSMDINRNIILRNVKCQLEDDEDEIFEKLFGQSK